MPIAHLIHGFVGSGKTTYAINLARELPALRLSVDDWLTSLYGQNPPSDKFEEYQSRITSLIWQVATQTLSLGQDVILDFGFWSRSSRDDARQRLQNIGVTSVLYRVVCSDNVMRERTLSRTAQMPDGALYIDENVLRELSRKFEPLGVDEPCVVVRTDSSAESTDSVGS
ncbi:MAG: AAA family ATPase [Phormidesmis sp.]